MKKKKRSAQVKVEECDVIMTYNSVNGENIILAKHKEYKKYYLGFRVDDTVPYSMVEKGREFSTKPYFDAIEALMSGKLYLTKV